MEREYYLSNTNYCVTLVVAHLVFTGWHNFTLDEAVSFPTVGVSGDSDVAMVCLG